SLVIQEATAVSPEGRISPGDLGIWKDEHVEKLKSITHFILSQNSIPGIQLAHAGRKGSVTPPWQDNLKIGPENDGWETVGPTDVGYHNDAHPPVALGQGGIEKVIADFKLAAARAVIAGYKVVEIHAAHGY